MAAVRERAAAERGSLEEGDDAAVVAGGDDAFLSAGVASNDGNFARVDVGAVAALVPHAGGLEPEDAGPSVPGDVLALGGADDLHTLGHVPVQDLVVARVCEQRRAILGPAHVRDEGRVALAHADELVPVPAVVHVDVVIVRTDGEVATADGVVRMRGRKLEVGDPLVAALRSLQLGDADQRVVLAALDAVREDLHHAAHGTRRARLAVGVERHRANGVRVEARVGDAPHLRRVLNHSRARDNLPGLLGLHVPDAKRAVVGSGEDLG